MKAVIWTKYGPSDVLQPGQLEKPVPGDDEMLVIIIAPPVFTGDCEMRSFDYPVSFWRPPRFMFGLPRPRIKVVGRKFAAVIDRTYPLEMIAEARN